jgi:hypothetical protein
MGEPGTGYTAYTTQRRGFLKHVIYDKKKSYNSSGQI